MKRPLGSMISSRSKKVACTVSAAALMLGVSSAATVGLHFQCSYSCGASAYGGFPVTLTAFGVPPSQWENLLPTGTGYGSCVWVAPGYETNEIIDTTTSTNGLNPLPNGSVDVTWFANCANFSGFFGYGDLGYAPPPTYGHPNNPPPNPIPSGESQVYLTFLRDGVNFGPNTSGSPAPYGSADNPLEAYYTVDVTGLKTLFTNTPFVVELIASSDSMQTLTNAFVIDPTNSITNSVSYPSTPSPVDDGSAPWLRGTGGGLSTGSGTFTNIDHIRIISAHPQHGGTGPPPTGYDHAGTIAGFIITDKPVVSMSPQSVPTAEPGDTVQLSAYAIGVPPLSYQWRFNGQPIPGATTVSNTISTISAGTAGNYDLVVSNAYGSATSQVAAVGEFIGQNPTTGDNVVYDSNPDNAQHDGLNMGATWAASNTDGTITRTGVMSFVALDTNGISVADNEVFDGTNGTVTMWLRSAGTDETAPGNNGASLFCRPNSTSANDFIIYQSDGSPGQIALSAPGGDNAFNSSAGISDNNWHFVAVTFDSTASGVAAIYIDGALDSTNSNTGSWSAPTGEPVQIGYTSDPAWRSYNGALDDVRYYSVKLTASEISAIFASGNSGALADPTDLQMQFNFTSAPGSALVLTWGDSSAILQSAPTVTGPWTDLTGTTSPYTVVPAASQQFFRFRYISHTPQTWVSNPYLM
jgi:hypothetical protein